MILQGVERLAAEIAHTVVLSDLRTITSCDMPDDARAQLLAHVTHDQDRASDPRAVSTRRRVQITLVRDRAHYDEVVMGAVARAARLGVDRHRQREGRAGRGAAGTPGSGARRVRLGVYPCSPISPRAGSSCACSTRAFPRARSARICGPSGGVLRGRGARHAALPAGTSQDDCRRRRGVYLGSASVGLGAKGDRRRNFEAGVLTRRRRAAR